MSMDKLIAGLNEDLAAELGTVIRYTNQASRCFGPVGDQVRKLLQADAADELGHAAYLSDVIVDLGGEPTTSPKQFDKKATVKEMLEQNIALEEGDAQSYTEHATLADELRLPDVKVRLEEMAADEAGHARELRRILKGM